MAGLAYRRWWPHLPHTPATERSQCRRQYWPAFGSILPALTSAIVSASFRVTSAADSGGHGRTRAERIAWKAGDFYPEVKTLVAR